MNIKKHNNEVEIKMTDDFDPVLIFECGQCFRWNINENGIYTGVFKGHVAQVRRNRETNTIFISGTYEDFNNIWFDYFDLERDYSQIRQSLNIDEFMKKATDFGTGIRLLKQDKWEALCSFIISQNNNIPRIKGIINSLCSLYGNKIDFNNQQYFTFPSAEKIASLTSNDLSSIRCGYRTEYIIKTAKDITCGKIDLDALPETSPEEARKELKKLHGVGDKVADCVLLFGLHMLDAFPLDVWMKRVMEAWFPGGLPDEILPIAGIAQQYLFHYARKVGVY